MDRDELCFTPATELAGLIRRKAVSPVEATRAVLDRIAAHDARINAFAVLDADGALAAARVAEDAVMAGAELGPLHGVPATVKDLADVRGLPTRRGSHAGPTEPAAADTPFAGRLRRAGAIILGKTTTSEYGWTGVSRSPLTGITHNPWRHGHNAGASSAGAGAAAAAGFGPLHQGSDGAGSIRMPAHFCGVFGLKPSFGRVPNWPVPNNDQTSHNGPLTRTVADAALMLQVMAGPSALDHWSLEAPPADYPARLGEGIAGMRVAYSADLGHARVDPEVAACVADAVRAFADLGVAVEEVPAPFGPEAPELVRFMWSVHMAHAGARYLERFRDRMDPGFVACVEAGLGRSADDYLAARARKLAYVEGVHRFFQDWDLLLTPAVSVAAFPADRLQPAHWPEHPWDWVSWAEFSYPFNFAGTPAASVPCGFTTGGLPVGLQIVGRRFADLTVLQASAAFEAARPWAERRPPL
ncbi:MAG: amidase family protein [Alphaproteobacteria bacterium]